MPPFSNRDKQLTRKVPPGNKSNIISITETESKDGFLRRAERLKNTEQQPTNPTERGAERLKDTEQPPTNPTEKEAERLKDTEQPPTNQTKKGARRIAAIMLTLATLATLAKTPPTEVKAAEINPTPPSSIVITSKSPQNVIPRQKEVTEEINPTLPKLQKQINELLINETCDQLGITTCTTELSTYKDTKEPDPTSFIVNGQVHVINNMAYLQKNYSIKSLALALALNNNSDLNIYYEDNTIFIVSKDKSTQVNIDKAKKITPVSGNQNDLETLFKDVSNEIKATHYANMPQPREKPLLSNDPFLGKDTAKKWQAFTEKLPKKLIGAILTWILLSSVLSFLTAKQRKRSAEKLLNDPIIENHRKIAAETQANINNLKQKENALTDSKKINDVDKSIKEKEQTIITNENSIEKQKNEILTWFDKAMNKLTFSNIVLAPLWAGKKGLWAGLWAGKKGYSGLKKIFK